METKEVSIIGVVLLAVLVVGFVGMTGNVVNETGMIVKCNLADFNGDGLINYNDRLEFGAVYASDYASGKTCSRADLNEDGKIDSLDNNEFGRAYSLVEGRSTGDCVLRKLACAELEFVEEVKEPAPEMTELPPEKIGFFQRIINFFKSG